MSTVETRPDLDLLPSLDEQVPCWDCERPATWRLKFRCKQGHSVTPVECDQHAQWVDRICARPDSRPMCALHHVRAVYLGMERI